jgi:hypothetical protein
MIQSLESPDSLLAALNRGESLPARWYTDPSITALEIEMIFRKTWNYIGPAKELAGVGDYITGNAGEARRGDPKQSRPGRFHQRLPASKA